MKKIFAVLFACSMVLAGCTDLTDEDIESIVDVIVEVPGCNGDETAYNYNPNATNNNACLTEMVLKNSVTEFIHLIDDGPEWGETIGMVMEGSETDESGATTSFSTTTAMSPDGMLMLVEMNMGMMVIEIGELMTENPDGTTNIQTTWMGNTFQMNSAALFDTAWNEQNYLEDDDDDHDDDDHGDGMDDDHGDDDHGDGMDDDHDDDDHGDGMDDDHGDDDHGDGMDDDHDDDDHDDGMDDDMSGDFDLGLPNTDVSIPEDFDPQTALWNAGLGTDNGFSFSTVMEHSADHSTTMTFTLSMDFVVTKMIMVDSYYGVDSTSSITILDAEETETLLTTDDTLMEFALPFNMEPISSDDDDHEGHDHEGHDHGDDDDDDQSDDGMGTDEGDGSGSDGGDESGSDGGESGDDGGMDDGDGTNDDDHDDDDHDGHDHDDHDEHDHHGATFDWVILTPDMMSPAIVEGSFADYHIVLSNCSMDDGSDEDGGMDASDMMETPTMTCGDDVMKVSVSDAATPSPGDDITFHDADNSGTISMGDMVHINPEIVVDEEWNMVRLYSNSTDAYSDDNPMLTPGFGAFAGIVALFGAALLTRRD